MIFLSQGFKLQIAKHSLNPLLLPWVASIELKISQISSQRCNGNTVGYDVMSEKICSNYSRVERIGSHIHTIFLHNIQNMSISSSMANPEKKKSSAIHLCHDSCRPFIYFDRKLQFICLKNIVIPSTISLISLQIKD